MSTTDLFVYGTLRPGEYNSDMLPVGATGFIPNCTTQGQIFFVNGRSGYPVAKFDRNGSIIGDLLACDSESREYRRIVRMEENAGYELRKIKVRTAGGISMPAWGFHYVGEPRGERIMDGDWRKAWRTSVGH